MIISDSSLDPAPARSYRVLVALEGVVLGAR